MTVIPFTQPAEALSGADWVWWWVDGSGSYGMLVQAKRVTVSQQSWHFDFSYPHGTGSQRSRLMSVAAHLGLMPVYALYLGTGNYRRWEVCSNVHQRGRCLQCVKRSVSLMPALIANDLIVSDSETTYEQSVAMEDLWSPTTAGALLSPALKKQLAPDLASFLSSRQDGTRAVVRSMMDRVLRVRAGAFGAAAPAASKRLHDGDHDRLGPVFRELPDDAGHWGLRYFEQILDPLTQAPPSYVVDIMSGLFDPSHLPPGMTESVAGIIVVPLAEPRPRRRPRRPVR